MTTDKNCVRDQYNSVIMTKLDKNTSIFCPRTLLCPWTEWWSLVRIRSGKFMTKLFLTAEVAQIGKNTETKCEVTFALSTGMH